MLLKGKNTTIYKMIKIIVQATPHCVELLNQVHSKIDDINRAGIRVNIEVASEDRIKMLNDNSINRLPVMITPDKKLIIGKDEIYALILKNLSGKSPRGARQSQQRSKRSNSDINVEDYLNDMIYEGVDRNKKGLVPPQDKEDMEAAFDYSTERKRYKAPKHYDNRGNSDESEDEPPKPVRPKKQHKVKQPEPSGGSSDDNVDLPHTSLEGYSGNTGGDPVDDEMMAALLANI